MKQAYFYIANGVTPLATGFNKKTEKIYFVFDDRNSREVYDTWCKNNNNIKPN
ncbi:hypothetical protein ACRTAF_002929 [Clostridium perfringens]|uniref:hypothetical protein n=1 Tax=Clostridium perfringens TaxID=1502 RepID=UPI00244A96E4|nr:hypothetical protein [Clostridium perfringens]MDH2340585.1 hypothetical protein [Clostridium perfringens]